MLRSFMTLIVIAACAPALSAQSGISFDRRHQQLTVDLPAVDVPANTGYNEDGVTVNHYASVPANLWLHGFDIDIIDQNGRSLGVTMLHHMGILASDRRDLFSPITLRIGAAARETGKVTVPASVGLPMKRGDQLLIYAMFHNPTNAAFPGVHLRIRFRATSQFTNPDAVTAYPFHLQASEQSNAAYGAAEFDIPVGYSVQTWEGRPAVDGRVLALGGHLHKYGTSISLIDVTENRVIFTARAKPDSTGEIESIEQKRWALNGPKLRADHLYRVTAEYNNTSGQPLAKAGMGIIAGLVIPSGGRWPKIDATDPTFVADLAARTGSGAHAAAHKHD
jgi:hypothetical protein